MTKLEQQILGVFLKAISNEAKLDQMAYEYLGFSSADYYGVPRPAKWIKRKGVKNTPKLLFFLSFLFWRFLGAYLFAALECFKMNYMVLLSASKADQSRMKTKKIAVVTSHRTTDVLNDEQLALDVDYWLELPWVKYKELEAIENRLDLVHLMSIKDCFKALYLSFIAINRVSKSRLLKSKSFQTYTVYKWFSLWLVLERLDCDLLTVAHNDRWAVLLDAVMQRKKGRSLHQAQHGLVWTGKDTSRYVLRLSARLNNVTNLYAYDEEAARIFKNGILSKHCSNKVKVKYFSPSLNLTDVDYKQQSALLIVGHPFYSQQHISLYEKISRELDVCVFYKAHPVAEEKAELKECGWTYINDKNFFPRVDLLLTYPSTMIDEYRGCGIGSVVHPREVEDIQMETLFQQIKDALTSM